MRSFDQNCLTLIQDKMILILVGVIFILGEPDCTKFYIFKEKRSLDNKSTPTDA